MFLKIMSGRDGKSGLFQKLINLMPPHDIYIETHLGNGAVLRNKKTAKRNIGIDIDLSKMKTWLPESDIKIELIKNNPVEYLKKQKVTDGTLIYCNPPFINEYKKNGAELYLYEYLVKEHEKLLELLKSLPCNILISGYESSFYTTSLKNWQSKTVRPESKKGDFPCERVWFNYLPPIKLHDYRWLGNNFRERERMKKMKAGWIKRITPMAELERKAFLSALYSDQSMKFSSITDNNA